MKKLLKSSLIISLVMLLGLATGCSNNNGGNGGNASTGAYDITVWVSESDGVAELTKQQIERFNAENNDLTINATIEGISEGEAATQMITDVESGADLYCFAQDQLARLVQAGALAVLGENASATVKEMNDAGAVNAATVDGKLYCYPLTSDNGYFLYYDKSVIGDDQVSDLATLVKACEDAGKFFSMEYKTSAWYNAAFFFATGCNSDWQTAADGSFTSVNDTFNSDAGLVAMKGMQILAKSPAANSSSDGADFSKGSAAVVTGTWALSTVKDILGDNMGVAELPSFTVDGQTYHLGSFSGNKLMGVKPQTDAEKGAALQRLALYLTNEECQLERFNNFGWGPSNKAAQATDAVSSDPTLVALAAQNAYATPQGQIHGSWWDIAKVLGTVAEEATSDDELKAGLQTYEDAINALFSMDPAIANAFTVIGAYEGHNWDFDAEMSQDDAGLWHTVNKIEFAAGDEFKVRKGLSWDEAYPADNFVVETAGSYTVTLDPTSGEVTLEG